MSRLVKTTTVVKTKTTTTTKRVKVVKREYQQGRGIVVTLPSVSAIDPALWGKPYTVSRLLTDGDDNPKLAKSNASGREYRTWGLTLSPANQSGYQTCSSSSGGCRASCLNFQGHARVFPSIHLARVAKTVACFEHREAFLAMLHDELDRVVEMGRRKGFVPAVRLNVLSDLMWERIAPALFSSRLDVQFYDYTKHVARMLRWCEGDLPANYHLTFSRSETNDADCLRVLAAGGTVAVVFATKELPATWNGYPVVSGDETDMRFRDEQGTVIGLYAKGTAKDDDSGFVVPTRRVPMQMASEADLMARHGLVKPPVLPPDLRNVLLERNYVRLVRGIGSTPYARSLGYEEASSIIGEVATTTARTFDPSKYADPLTGRHFGPADVLALGDQLTEVDRVFRGYVGLAINSALRRHIAKRDREVASGIGDDYASAVVSRDRYGPADMCAATEQLRLHGSFDAALAAHRQEVLN